jgi:universal stress protein E
MTRLALATDFSEASRPALRRAARLAGAGGEIIVIHVHAPLAANGDPRAREIAAEERNAIALLFAAARDELERGGARVTELPLEGVPHEAILEALRSGRVEVLVCGTHGRSGLRRVFLGSVAEKVARASAVPVLVARGPAERDLERVLVAIELDERGARVAAAACALAAPGATVDVVHFISIASLVSVPGRAYVTTELPRLEADARRRGGALVDELRGRGVEARFTVEIGDPREGVLRRVEERAHDLVAVGSHGRGGLARLTLGSVSESILRHAPCSVLVVR